MFAATCSLNLMFTLEYIDPGSKKNYTKRIFATAAGVCVCVCVCVCVWVWVWVGVWMGVWVCVFFQLFAFSWVIIWYLSVN